MRKQQQVELDRIPSGTQGVVRRIGGGKEFANRLAAMGLSVGSRIQVLQNREQGPVLVLVRETRIALGRGEAIKILVEEARSEQPQHQE
jgi:ferrous iron transport protein A